MCLEVQDIVSHRLASISRGGGGIDLNHAIRLCSYPSPSQSLSLRMRGIGRDLSSWGQVEGTLVDVVAAGDAVAGERSKRLDRVYDIADVPPPGDATTADHGFTVDCRGRWRWPRSASARD